VAHVSTYLDFVDSTEEAFEHYKRVFGTENASPVLRYGDMPSHEGMPEMDEAMRRLVLNVQLPILGGHLLMGSDVPERMGLPLAMGDNVQITLHPDSRAEADRLFVALSEGGTVHMPLQDLFWGSYHGSLKDRFGVWWLIDCAEKG